MKPAINQQATRTTNGTQNWTDSSITSDETCLLLFGTEAVANNTTTAGAAKLFMGATDGTNNIGYSVGTLDAGPAVSTNSHSLTSNTKCLLRTTASGAENLAASVSAILSNGVTLNQTTSDGGAYLFNGLSLAGSDHVVKFSSASFATTDTSKVVTHGDTSAPDAVILFFSIGATTSDNGNIPQRTIIAFWDGTNSVSSSMKCSAGVSPTVISARTTNDLGHQINATDSDVATMSIGSVGATTFTLTRTATDTTAMFVTCISIRHTSGTWAAKAGIVTLPTSTGNVALITGMAVQPQVLITIATRLTATTFTGSSDAGGSLSFGIACNNTGTTQQFACAMTEQNNVATTVAKCYTSNNAALLSLDNTGAVVNKATVNSWDSGGVTLNHSAVGASAFEAIYLAFGISSGGSPIVSSADEYYYRMLI